VDEHAPQPRLTDLPNLLSLGRLAATPVVIGLLLLGLPGSGLWAAIIFAVASITDFVDGRLARARGLVSRLGVFLDLAADKVLVAGVLIALVELGAVPTWIAATIVIREFVVQAVRQLAATEDVVIAARRLGKAKTVATLVGMFVVILALDASTGGPLASLGITAALSATGFWLMVLATILTVVSGLAYLRGALPVLTSW
jgi:CDP-diacylglycerol---glycerol-3-phosphate 3-phosphatidyltransferase